MRISKNIIGICLGAIISTNAFANNDIRHHHYVHRVTKFKPTSTMQILGIPISSGPYIGVQTSFDAHELLSNLPSINQDLRLLQFRHSEHEGMHDQGIKYPRSPFLRISGALTAEASQNRGFDGRHTSDIDLNNSELDVIAEINPRVTGFMNFSFDNSATSPTRSANSAFLLDKGFIVIGDLNRSPYYVSFGQQYVPFGQFSSFMISSAMTKQLGRAKARTLVLGFSDPAGMGFNSSIFAFRGDAHAGTGGRIDHFGGNITYTSLLNAFKSSLSISAINDLSNSDIMQTNGGFGGFGASTTNQILVRRVPAVDLRGYFDIDKTSVKAEYVTPIMRYHNTNLSFNGSAAKPTALNLEAGYNFTIGRHYPAQIAAAYGETQESVELGLPKQRYAVSMHASFWRDTVQAIEFRHDINYGQGTYGNGTGSTTPIFAQSKVSNGVRAQFSVYF